MLNQCPNCKKDFVSLDKGRTCAYCGYDLCKNFKIESTGYVAITSDNEKILTNRGFALISNIKQASPKIFASPSNGRQAISDSYPRGVLDNIFFLKIKISYEAIKNES